MARQPKDLIRHLVGERWRTAKSLLYSDAVVSSPLNPLVRAGIRVLPPVASVQRLLESGASLARFGDGELSIAIGAQGPRFQTSQKELGARLREVLHEDDERLLLGISEPLVNLRGARQDDRYFWGDLLRRHGKEFARVIPHDRTYLDTHLTRPYIPTDDQEIAFRRFDQLRELWRDRDLLFVEGEYSRSGIGNDLFDGARSIRRLIGPPADAFSQITEIEAAVREHAGDALVICCLGPTATVIAADLAQEGIRCLDLGHIDMEYMWALAGRGRIPVPGRLVNEIAQQADLALPREDAELWESQVIARVGV